MHVHGYKEEDTITTYFDMTVLNGLDRFHLVLDALKQLPQLIDSGANLMQWNYLLYHKWRLCIYTSQTNGTADRIYHNPLNSYTYRIIAR